MLAIHQHMGFLWTDGEAMAAADASVGIEHDFRLEMDAFGVLTPETVERTTFQKDNRPDARSIMK
jgi:hypothetical protein